MWGTVSPTDTSNITVSDGYESLPKYLQHVGWMVWLLRPELLPVQLEQVHHLLPLVLLLQLVPEHLLRLEQR
jgi:hypothetical protein